MSAIDAETFENTNFVFDIEANRRRRAELANDVTELISISKFFQQHYASDDNFMSTTPKSSKKKIELKSEKNRVNATTAHQNKGSQKSKQMVANATLTHPKHKQMPVNSDTWIMQPDIDTNLPPIFDKLKLHEYCVDAVDRFFHGAIAPANQSDQVAIEKAVQVVPNSNEKTKMTKNAKYASISARYMHVTPRQVKIDIPKRANSAYGTLVSAKSREILHKAAVSGVEFKKHSCLSIHSDGEPKMSKTKTKRIQKAQSFQELHPNIELISSNSIVPKRVYKLSKPEQTVSTSTMIFEPDVDKIEHKGNKSGKNKFEIIEKSTILNGSGDNNFKQNTTENQNSVICLNEDIIIGSERVDEIKEEKPPLKLQHQPNLCIKPTVQCEIKKVYAIEIKSNQATTTGNELRNNNKVIECVYEPFAEEMQQTQNEYISLQLKGTEKLLFNHNLRENDFCTTASDSGNEKRENLTTNKYFAPFVNRKSSNRFECSNMAINIESSRIASSDTFNSNRTENATSSNLSMISHLTDDEKYRTDRQYVSMSSRRESQINKSPAKGVIDKILEVEGFKNGSNDGETHGNDQNKDKMGKIDSNNFDDLREILQKIRNDKTALELAAESEYNTPKPSPNIKPSHQPMLDRETQCDSLLESIEKQPSKLNRQSKKILSPAVLKSPKFNRTIDSIRSSAKRLEFECHHECNIVTQQQVNRAAQKFLKSILKNRDHTKTSDDESETPDCSNASSMLDMNVSRKKYQIINDRIVHSNYGGFIDRNLNENGSETSSCEIPSLKLNVSTARTEEQCAMWNSDSDSRVSFSSVEGVLTQRSVRKVISTRNKQMVEDDFDLSDGEILSDGETRPPNIDDHF